MPLDGLLGWRWVYEVVGVWAAESGKQASTTVAMLDTEEGIDAFFLGSLVQILPILFNVNKQTKGNSSI